MYFELRRNMCSFVLFVSVLVFVSGSLGCGQKANLSNDSSGIWSQSAVAAVSGAVTTTAGDPIAFYRSVPRSALARWTDLAIPLLNAFASHSCPNSTTDDGSGCSSSGRSMTLNFGSGGCSNSSHGGTWMGGSVLTTSSTDKAPSCGQYPEVDGSKVKVLTRTYTGNLLQSPTYRIDSSGDTSVILDTSAPSNANFSNANSSTPTSGTGGWLSNLSIGGGYTRSFVSSKTHAISFSIRAVGYTGTNPGPGKATFDHTISTQSIPGMGGSSSGNTLQVVISGTSKSSRVHTVNGTVYLQDNLMKFSSFSVFKNVAFSRDCCFPISGSVTTSYSSGPMSGQSDTMTFNSSTCEDATLGQVQYTNSKGANSNKILSQCY